MVSPFRVRSRFRRRWHIKRAAVLTASDGAWWLAGGVNPLDCVAAYQGKGAGSYAASRTNLHNPGVLDLIEGNPPDWENDRGWYFGDSNGKVAYLDTGIVPDSRDWTYLVQFSDYSGGDSWNDLFGFKNETDGLVVSINPNRYQRVLYTNGTAYTMVTPACTGGNLSIAGGDGFRDGVNEASGIADWGGKTNTLTLYLGAKNRDGSPYAKLYAYVIAFAVYNAVLSGSQVAALAAAMAAL